MNNELLQLLNALKTAEGLSLASVAKEVNDLKEDYGNAKKDLESILNQVTDLLKDTITGSEVSETVSKIKEELKNLQESSSGEVKKTTQEINKSIVSLISDLRSELEEKINDKSFLDAIHEKIEAETSFDKFLGALKKTKLETGDIEGLEDFVKSQIPENNFSNEIADLRNTVASVGTKNYVPAGVEIFHNGQNFGRIPSINFVGGTVVASASRIDVNLAEGGGGGSSLPDQSGENGKFLSTDGTNPFWATLSGGGDMAKATYDPANGARQVAFNDELFSGDYDDLTNKPTIPTISDTAYNATSWNANTDGATKNAIRDKIETMDSAITLNTAKETNATHTGEVTGATALTLNLKAIDNRTDTAVAPADYFLFLDATDTTLKKDTIQGILDLVSGGSGDVSKVGTPVDNQVGVWTGDGTIEGTSGLVFSSNALGIGGVGNVGAYSGSVATVRGSNSNIFEMIRKGFILENENLFTQKQTIININKGLQSH